MTNQRRRKDGAWIVATVASFAAGVAVLIGTRLLLDATFFDAFFANFLSTVAGFFIGVPVAIWVALTQATKQREEADRAEVVAGTQREVDVLGAS